jgi:hypothetical protein
MGGHQLLMLLPECLAAHSQPLGLLSQLTTGGAGVACDHPPETSHLPDISASLNHRTERERGKHHHTV